MSKRIRINAFDMSCITHQSPGLWAHPEDQSTRYKELDYWVELAKLLERGKFDSLFIADVLGVYDTYQGSADASIRRAMQIPVHDPMMQVSAMAAATSKLGFGITVSSTYEQPYALARRFSTLDHFTKGRIAWNVVTSYLDGAARNLGLEQQMPHDERYDRAEEFMEVCYKLWEGSWESDAVLNDTATQVYADPAKVHGIAHKGRFFSVPGVHLSEPSPQRTPVIWQAGTSGKGRAFAARHAEAVFTVAPTAKTLRGYVDDIRKVAGEHGRDPGSVKIFTEITTIVAPTDSEAQARYEELLKWIDLESGLAFYAGITGIDLSQLDPHEPLKYVDTDSARFALEIFSKADPERTWTPDEVVRYVGIGAMGPVIVGSPSTVADELERWMDEADIDGFNLAYAVTPGTFEEFVDLVVPELQCRGRYWLDYDDSDTLRERLYEPGQSRVRADHPAAAYRR
ncbi:LLM class flavin-dependent oxidoreductase [Pseudomonas gingeri]|uniref:LLM class flavin-dependent oxidoreductase n=2 Tax=Pseudomonas gingeri TaxID=117681 RepID=A0A7Y7YI09_9PSED|nr:LLM class flavin-dependent oxidoreductase [Pseudomonas gingeri]NWA02694.1 LLM class flavin-dependent oxidoreductase [Pseudomonas gingeri]NWA12132.1 LLM class flavin-dependent oxidoreductase [Pseudomonas gingeri]NWA57461.1 LLM class flavin-dependent oxidoreductase [Pseudomonas gingeri]NWA93804.1 LLM class flavin-dependent oxidoreductase [Pseudomonas gingeri]NWB03276.1 LLM class flavin-dependent oxidoreductase [Pseudomonas gingeri]